MEEERGAEQAWRGGGEGAEAGRVVTMWPIGILFSRELNLFVDPSSEHSVVIYFIAN